MWNNLSDSSWTKSATVMAFRSHFSLEAIFFSVCCWGEGGGREGGGREEGGREGGRKGGREGEERGGKEG